MTVLRQIDLVICKITKLAGDESMIQSNIFYISFYYLHFRIISVLFPCLFSLLFHLQLAPPICYRHLDLMINLYCLALKIWFTENEIGDGFAEIFVFFKILYIVKTNASFISSKITHHKSLGDIIKE